MQDATPAHGLRPLRMERRRKRDALKTWAPIVAIVAFIASLGTAAPFVFGIIRWPWPTRDEADAAHAQLRTDLDSVRAEVRSASEDASHKLDLILERLPSQKGHHR